MKRLLPYLVFALSCFLAVKSYAQKQVVYINRNFDKVKSPETAAFFVVAERRDDKKYDIVQYRLDSTIAMKGVATRPDLWGYDGDFVFYHHNGKIDREGRFIKDRKEGLWRSYNDSGALLSERFYKNGRIDSFFIYYFPNTGHINSKSIYKKGECVSSVHYNEAGEEISEEEYLRIQFSDTANVKQAEILYLGGVSYYLAGAIRYPADDRDAGITGKVIINYAVDTTGMTCDFDIIRSLSPSCDHEVMRVVSMMPRWKPGTKEGKPVKLYYTLPVTFGIE